ncbi:hypothetical protein LP117_04435 [Moraxella bovis]|uniref:hypothetical protein n=1 Tax=Moraxella bovis TaxID=476 RepID=UPI0022275A94|nr:hypothetical protein [Moraxella bovis]UZA25334.1 hypothetical protein LP117_02400 [Moraxella bovis]UZA25708.1 hypothetical protein LP117_04435 [Moraxella bovis]UZA28799.1 hypothetical protein LP097_07385 [Moraxella bovis]UZA29175.1 hypothetical protein LP097_09465 [Moraxella bovis]
MELIQQPQNALDFQINGNTAKLVGIIQTMVTGSFAKKYGNTNIADVVSVFGVLTSDLSNEQINQGLNTVLQMGYCPDVALFRRWCLGLKDFDNADHIADSYVGKNGALSNILAWRGDSTQPISTAEKQAYDKTMHLFSQADYNGNMTITAHSAFKDHYEMIVHELVVNKVKCERYIAPIAITHAPSEPSKQLASDEFVHSLFGLNKMDVLA